MFAIYLKEINSFLNSLIAYIVIAVFLLGVGLFMWVFPDTSVLNYGFADMSTLFNMAPYLFLFLIPAITMRSFAEEKKTGTIELLFTRPISDLSIILGKYFASLTIVGFSLLPTIFYFISIYKLGTPQGNLDIAGIMGSYIGLFLLGAVFTAVGIFCSSNTDNQIISFILAVFISYVFYEGFNYFSSMTSLGSWGVFIASFGISSHYTSLSKGLIDSRYIIYFLSVISFLIFSTKLILGSRKW